MLHASRPHDSGRLSGGQGVFPFGSCGRSCQTARHCVNLLAAVRMADNRRDNRAVALLAPRDELERRVRRILDQAANRPGHIFNLGHGILQETPVENVKAVVEMVHEFSKRL